MQNRTDMNNPEIKSKHINHIDKYNIWLVVILLGLLVAGVYTQVKTYHRLNKTNGLHHYAYKESTYTSQLIVSGLQLLELPDTDKPQYLNQVRYLDSLLLSNHSLLKMQLGAYATTSLDLNFNKFHRILKGVYSYSDMLSKAQADSLVLNSYKEELLLSDARYQKDLAEIIRIHGNEPDHSYWLFVPGLLLFMFQMMAGLGLGFILVPHAIRVLRETQSLMSGYKTRAAVSESEAKVSKVQLENAFAQVNKIEEEFKITHQQLEASVGIQSNLQKEIQAYEQQIAQKSQEIKTIEKQYEQSLLKIQQLSDKMSEQNHAFLSSKKQLEHKYEQAVHDYQQIYEQLYLNIGLLNAFSKNPDNVFAFYDRDGNVLMCSQSFADLFDKKPEQIAGKQNMIELFNNQTVSASENFSLLDGANTGTFVLLQGIHHDKLVGITVTPFTDTQNQKTVTGYFCNLNLNVAIYTELEAMKKDVFSFSLTPGLILDSKTQNVLQANSKAQIFFPETGKARQKSDPLSFQNFLPDSEEREIFINNCIDIDGSWVMSNVHLELKPDTIIQTDIHAHSYLSGNQKHVFIQFGLLPASNANVLPEGSEITVETLGQLQKYQTIYQEMTDALAIIVNDHIEEMNQAGLEKFGYSDAELNGLHLDTFFQRFEVEPGAGHLFYNQCLSDLEAEQEIKTEWSFQLSDGNKMLGEVTLKKMSTISGDFLKLRIRDITAAKLSELGMEEAISELKSRETEMLESSQELIEVNKQLEDLFVAVNEKEEFLNNIIENLPVALMCQDATNQLSVTLWNRKSEEIYGVGRNDILDQNLQNVLGESSATMLREQSIEALQSGITIEIKKQDFTSPNLGEIKLHTIHVPIYDEDGKPQYLISIAEDISRAHQAEEQLKKSEERLNDALAIAQLGTWELDLATGLLHVDDLFRDWMGLTEATLPGNILPLEEFSQKYVHPEDVIEIQMALQGLLTTTDGIFNTKFHYRLVNGIMETRYVTVIGRGIFNELNQPIKAYGTTQDVTELRLREIEKAKEDARKLKHEETLNKMAKSDVLNSGNLEAALEFVTESLSEALDVERASLWILDEEFTKISCIDLYERTADTHSRGVELFRKDFPAYFDAVKTENIIAAHDAHTDPQTKEFSEVYLSVLGINSMLDIPIRRGGKMIGVICNEQVGPARTWYEDEQFFASTVSDLISLAMEAEERLTAYNQLQESQNELSTALNKIAQSEAAISAVIENTSDFICSVDKNFRLITFNSRFEKNFPKMFGATLTESMTLPSLLKNEQQKQLQQLLELALEGNAFSDEIEISTNHFKGYLEFSFNPIYEKSGVIDGVALFIKDITERKQVEQLLKEKELKLTDAMNIANLATWEIHVADGTILFDPRYYALTGLSNLMEADQSKHFNEILSTHVHPESYEIVRSILSETFDTQESNFSRAIEYRLPDSETSPRYGYLSIKVAFNERQVLTKVYGTFQDITERKLTQMKALEAIERQQYQDAQLTELAKNEILTSGKSYQQALQLTVESLAHAVHADFAKIWFFDDNFEELQCQTAYDGNKQQFIIETSILANEAQHFFKILRQDGFVHYFDGCPLDTEVIEFRDVYIIPRKLKTAIQVPVRKSGAIVGILSCEFMKDREILPDEINFIHSVSDMVALAIEAHERHTLLTLLSENEARLSDAMEIANLATWELEIANQVMQFDVKFLGMLGLHEDQVSNQMSLSYFINNYVHQEDAPHLLNLIQQMREKPDFQKSYQLVYRIYPQNYDIRYISTNLRALAGNGDTIVKIFGTQQDITETTLAEMAKAAARDLKIKLDNKLAELARLEPLAEGFFYFTLQKFNEEIVNILEIGACGVWLYKNDRQILTCLHEYSNVPDYTQEVTELVIDDFPQFFQTLAEGKIQTYKYAKYAPETKELNSIFWEPRQTTSIVLMPIERVGRILGYLVIENIKITRAWEVEELNFLKSISDLIIIALESSERRDALIRLEAKEEELTKLNSELQDTVHLRTQALQELKTAQQRMVQTEKMAALGQLIAGVAHEVNTPISAVKASARNIIRALPAVLTEVPLLLKNMDDDTTRLFMKLVNQSTQSSMELTTMEERKYRKLIQEVLDDNDIENAYELAKDLVEIRIIENVEDYVPLFEDEDSTEILDKVYKLGQFKKNLDNIEIAAEKTARVVLALKSYSHVQQADRFIPVFLHENVETILTLYNNQTKYGVGVERHFEEFEPIPVYPDEIGQVWTNIVSNAIHAMKGKGTMIVDVFKEGEYGCVRITDNGPGIPPEIQARIFEPFFTTKPQGEGTGLGLDICKKIVEKHNGLMELTSEPGKTSFLVKLPLTQASEKAD